MAKPPDPRPGDRVEEEAARNLRGTPEMDGPHIIGSAAEQLRRAMVPDDPYELDYLAGRIAISIEEAQLALGIGPRTMRTALRNGEIPSVRIGGRRLIPVKSLERHLEALAYATSGALDQWQLALIQGEATKMRQAQRRALERRRYLRRRLRELHDAITEGRGALAKEQLIRAQGELAELQKQRAVSTTFARSFRLELEQAERELDAEEL